MRASASLLLACLLPATMAAQAPPGADLWRVTAQSIPVPVALADGASGVFWNPAADAVHGRLDVGVHLVNTSDVLGLSGLLVAASRGIPGGLHISALLGRMQVRDLVRTTTSPNSEPGGIPVYEQFAGVALGASRGRTQVGAVLRLHDERFDVLREQGLTLDVGLVTRPHPRIRIAAATHFLPVLLSREPTTDLYAGTEVLAAEALPVAGVATRLTARYGVTYRPDGSRVDHTVGLGIGLGRQVAVSTAMVREAGITSAAWRPVLGISLAIGRYVLTAARGSGLNDVGATYRIGLDVGVGP